MHKAVVKRPGPNPSTIALMTMKGAYGTKGVKCSESKRNTRGRARYRERDCSGIARHRGLLLGAMRPA